MPTAYDPINAGSLAAKNRVWMAPLTRARATRDFLPTPLMAEYYAQRASAGLIISEATAVSLQGQGWPRSPGIWSDAQTEAWKDTPKAVHEKGGKIYMQLWHMGRGAHSKTNGMQPVAPSSDPLSYQLHTYEGKLDAEKPHQLTKEEIKGIVKDFELAAKNAILAGFDGVQVQVAVGFGSNIEEFLFLRSNKRTDEYGGSIENRLLFLDEILSAVTSAVGSDRTSCRISPNVSMPGSAWEIYEDAESLEELTRQVAKLFEKYKLAFVEIKEPGPDTTYGLPPTVPPQHKTVRSEYSGVLVLNTDIHAKEAEDLVGSGEVDAVTIGRPFIANPDLVERFKSKWPVAEEPPVSTWYIDGHPDYDSQPKEEGYTDFPKYTA